MDFENHHFLYFFEKQKNTKKNRKAKLSLSYKDFHCFQLMGFTSDRVSSDFLVQKSPKKHTREKRHFSGKPIKTNKISTFSPPEIIKKKC